ncbi:hypothetical protein NC652_018113 [Populus alba x Populus x berolinensis]|nr:hypothetical protein NC652_018113 [Populus alba x Populus x berolinensis]
MKIKPFFSISSNATPSLSFSETQQTKYGLDLLSKLHNITPSLSSPKIQKPRSSATSDHLTISRRLLPSSYVENHKNGAASTTSRRKRDYAAAPWINSTSNAAFAWPFRKSLLPKHAGIERGNYYVVDVEEEWEIVWNLGLYWSNTGVYDFSGWWFRYRARQLRNLLCDLGPSFHQQLDRFLLVRPDIIKRGII